MIKQLIRRILRSGSKAAQKEFDPTEPQMLSATQHGIDPALVSANAIRVTHTLQEAGFKAFLVGGAVRDLLLHVKPKDFDIATNATPEQVKKLFRRAFIIGRRFQIVHVMFGSDLLEVTTFRGASATAAPKDEFGRVLRDNTFGPQHEDALRRDFTINAMYYDPSTQSVLDYHGGIEDIRSRTLRVIGEPEARYREDPVRMLRVVRFAAKLDFSIDPTTEAPIQTLAPLIHNVPSARIFDEMLKLLMSGHALACLRQLRKEGLHRGLLPLLDVVLEQPLGEKFVTLALDNTDARVRAGKPVSPGFLFASLLWHEVLEKWTAYQTGGEAAIPALYLAADEVLNTRANKLELQRRIAADMRDIWSLQPRFERRSGKAPYRLLENPRLRAGYDFLLLRCESGEIDAELGNWWTAFIADNGSGREQLILDANKNGPSGARKRPRRRTHRKAGLDEAASSTQPHKAANTNATDGNADSSSDSSRGAAAPNRAPSQS